MEMSLAWSTIVMSGALKIVKFQHFNIGNNKVTRRTVRMKLLDVVVEILGARKVLFTRRTNPMAWTCGLVLLESYTRAKLAFTARAVIVDRSIVNRSHDQVLLQRFLVFEALLTSHAPCIHLCSRFSTREADESDGLGTNIVLMTDVLMGSR